MMETSPTDPPPDDALLLRRWVREGSQAAFRALAERHLPLVWSTARRVVHGDDTLAADIAQAVLADFAHKAHTLPPEMPPAGWLHRHTVFTATKTLRSESRRRARERAAAHPSDAMPAPDVTWSELAPHLDTALDRLRAPDRQAILLRYFEDRPLREISRALGTTEEAARKRIDRALLKLLTLLRRRGIVPALGILALMLREKSVAVPPAEVTRRITASAWARVESGVLGAASSLPWWRSRRALSTAAAVCAVVILVFAWRSGFFTDGPHQRPRAALTLPPQQSPARVAEENFPPVTLTATLMMLPEKEVAALMFDYVPGGDDEVLYRQLLPRAAALQKLVKPEETFATTGHSLVILTGPAKPSHAAFERKPVPPAEEVDPFFEPPVRQKPSASLRRVSEYKYPTEFDPPDGEGRIKPSEFSMRYMGTLLDANVSPPDAQGNLLVECILDHMFAPPEEEEIVSLPLKGEIASDGRNSYYQPVFRSTQWQLGKLILPTNATVLAGIMNLPPDILPEGDRTPRRLLLFLQINP